MTRTTGLRRCQLNHASKRGHPYCEPPTYRSLRSCRDSPVGFHHLQRIRFKSCTYNTEPTVSTNPAFSPTKHLDKQLSPIPTASTQLLKIELHKLGWFYLWILHNGAGHL